MLLDLARLSKVSPRCRRPPIHHATSRDVGCWPSILGEYVLGESSLKLNRENDERVGTLRVNNFIKLKRRVNDVNVSADLVDPLANDVASGRSCRHYCV